MDVRTRQRPPTPSGSAIELLRRERPQLYNFHPRASCTRFSTLTRRGPKLTLQSAPPPTTPTPTAPCAGTAHRWRSTGSSRLRRSCRTRTARRRCSPNGTTLSETARTVGGLFANCRQPLARVVAPLARRPGHGIAGCCGAACPEARRDRAVKLLVTGGAGFIGSAVVRLEGARASLVTRTRDLCGLRLTMSPRARRRGRVRSSGRHPRTAGTRSHLRVPS